ncbi:hypothetical protein GCM10020331_014720 [Ectobacillus funiculus]
MSYQEFFWRSAIELIFLFRRDIVFGPFRKNLDGAFVQFERQNDGESETETLHVRTADGRKYFFGFF